MTKSRIGSLFVLFYKGNYQVRLSKCQTEENGIRYGLGTDLVRRWYGANLKKIKIQKERKWVVSITKLIDLRYLCVFLIISFFNWLCCRRVELLRKNIVYSGRCFVFFINNPTSIFIQFTFFPLAFIHSKAV